ncbi:uncharacterized protein LOC106460035 [Limulus polyphemus]|uniref:Uncharacterized protein LOC106460035 n=1 Tax=Limulus polyphemus TaxID=6850 RepID=A0ABM1B5E7_LIMPO|nr:uncharacterized protein LOC106460035 [Limulus polyphemus]XP_013775174.1 uncharacterized protein LOC106460035 [Limulus polyphemus]XP_022242336.1 uncharacterized protein LOC106460035 [Limulus polyphemus]XP_022242337.1 uncharacterized protein LOC106460035 [Limulus polyphemus]XP_022242338.1 uncharacterized protein LOC106460035 [Limulus polyphemus]XP_022242339.1 uncharacterized protein LOC106460035 [Limulus polyphemus]
MDPLPSKAKPVSTRKFGIPAWMTRELNKLNVCKDLDKYGSSPPTSDTDFFWDMEKMGESTIVTSSIAGHQDISTDNSSKDTLQVSFSMIKPTMFKEPPKLDLSVSGPVLKAPSVDDKLYHSHSCSSSASAESTPNATPCSSPSISRKVKESALQANPALACDQSWNSRWLSSTVTSHGKNTTVYNAPLSPVKEAPDGPLLPKADTPRVENLESDSRVRKTSAPSITRKKYLFSNSDINIVSPTSW